jgi:hypothetical protein
MERTVSPLRKKRYPLVEDKHESGGDGKLRPDHAKAMPNATWYPTMSAYGHYRAMILAASFPDEPKIGKSSISADHPFSAGYSSADQDMINRAAKICGFAPRKLSNSASAESDEIHNHSPNNHNSGIHPTKK